MLMEGDIVGTFIIAEAGVNHNGSIDVAKQLVDVAKQSGADCIKFQTFIAENLVSKKADLADYQIKNMKNNQSQYSMLKELELSFQDFCEIKKYCEQVGIIFLSTPFDFASIDFLQQLDMAYWKIPSGEITNLPYLEKIASTRKPIILSTGMSNEDEVRDAITILKRGGSDKIALMHCTSEYPAPFCEVNLRAMVTLRDVFGYPVGYSDHTEGWAVPVAAVALGADIIEKHFTLDKKMEGPDHKASLEPQELKKMICQIRNVQCALGTGEKGPQPSEVKNMKIARKSIVAKRNICKGEVFSTENITIKRPGTGVSPMLWYDVIGQAAIRDFKEDELIEVDCRLGENG